MKFTCLNCDSTLDANFTGKAGVGKCPKCGCKMSFPEATVEYKILTQNMLCGSSGFDKNAGHAEGVLNALALEGWRVVGCMTQAVTAFSLSGLNPSAVILLERPLKC